MKILGAVLVLAVFVLAALRLIREKKERVKALTELSRALELLRGELALRATPLPELLALASRQSEGAGRELLSRAREGLDRLGEESFSEIWEGEVRSCCGMLAPEEVVSLTALGQVLGRFALEQQLRALERCAASFEESRGDLMHSLPAVCRMILGLCVSCAALIIILLY